MKSYSDFPDFAINVHWRAGAKFMTCSRTGLSGDPHPFDIEWPALNFLNPFQAVDGLDTACVWGRFVR
jgi:hypothetical protein